MARIDINTALLQAAVNAADEKHVLFLEQKVLKHDNLSVQILDRWVQQKSQETEEKNWTKSFYCLHYTIKDYVEHAKTDKLEKLAMCGRSLMLKTPKFGTSGGKEDTMSKWPEGIMLKKPWKRRATQMGVPKEKMAKLRRKIPTAQRLLHECDSYRRMQFRGKYPKQAEITLDMTIRMAIMLTNIAEVPGAATLDRDSGFHNYGFYGNYMADFCAEEILSGSG